MSGDYNDIARSLADSYGVDLFPVVDKVRGDDAYSRLVQSPADYESAPLVVFVRLTNERVRRMSQADLETGLFNEAITAMEVFPLPETDPEERVLLKITDVDMALDSPYVAYFSASPEEMGFLYGLHITEYWGVSHLDTEFFERHFGDILREARIYTDEGESRVTEVVAMIGRLRGG